MIGLEFLAESDDELAKNRVRAGRFMGKLRDRGLLVGKGGLFGTVIRLKPPMCWRKEDAVFCCDQFEEVLKEEKDL
jgi:alanine-glyoxylate transaminase / (R)-3-amino-2-methylpropionate-pyruvate transaminase